MAHDVLIVTERLGRPVVPSRKISYHANYSCSILKRMNLPKEAFTITDEDDAKGNGCVPCGACFSVKKERPAKPTKANIATTSYPIKEMIPVWTTSDGREWSCEVDALRHQLDIERKRK